MELHDSSRGACRPRIPAPHVSLAEKLNRLFTTASRPGEPPLTNRNVAEGMSRQGSPISESFIHYLRSGQRDNPTRRHLEGLARFFRVPVCYFFDCEHSRKLFDELDFLIAMRDADVRTLAARSATLPPPFRRWLADALEGLVALTWPAEGPPAGRSGPG